MNLKTFRGTTMAEALAAVKRELGPDAVILSTRHPAAQGLFGQRGRGSVEIVAAIQPPKLDQAEQCPAPQTATPSREIKNPMHAPSSERGDKSALGALSKQVSSLRSTIEELVLDRGQQEFESAAAAIKNSYEQLIASQVSNEIAIRLVRRLQSEFGSKPDHTDPRIRQRLREYIESMLPAVDECAEPDGAKPSVIALVGPAGVGKTTAAAKLATHYKLRHNKRVALISTDCVKAAGTAQLDRHARIIDVPFRVAHTPDELRSRVDEFAEFDFVFIDTAGCSRRDSAGLNALQKMLDASSATDRHLVLAATQNDEIMRQTYGGFAHLGINRVIMTNVDEAIGFGIVLNVLHQAQATLSYVSTGREITSGIEVNGRSKLAELIAPICPAHFGG